MDEGCTPKQLFLVNYYKGGHSMELRRGDMMRLQEICVPLVLGMDGFSFARIRSLAMVRGVL